MDLMQIALYYDGLIQVDVIISSYKQIRSTFLLRTQLDMWAIISHKLANNPSIKQKLANA